MATGTVTVLQDCRIYADEFDLSGQANNVGTALTAAMKDKTSYDSGGWTETRPTLLKGKYDIESYLDEGLIGDGLAEGTQDVLCTFVVDDAEFSVGWGLTTNVESWGQPWQVGELVGQSLSLDGSGAMWRGELLLPKAAKTTAGAGSARQLGAVSATQSVYAHLHVFAVTGGSVTVRIESDDNSGFSSAATRHTFTAASAVGAQKAQVAGAFTDDYWRVAWTQTASSATFAVVVGIQ